MLIGFAQYLLKYLVDPYKMFADSCRVRYYEKKKQKFFFTGKFAFLSNICDFNNLLGPKKML